MVGDGMNQRFKDQRNQRDVNIRKNDRDVKVQEETHSRFRARVISKVNRILKLFDSKQDTVFYKEYVDSQDMVYKEIYPTYENVALEGEFPKPNAHEMLQKIEESILRIPSVYHISLGITLLAYAEYINGYRRRAELDFALAKEVALMHKHLRKVQELIDIKEAVFSIDVFMTLCGLKDESLHYLEDKLLRQIEEEKAKEFPWFSPSVAENYED